MAHQTSATIEMDAPREQVVDVAAAHPESVGLPAAAEARGTGAGGRPDRVRTSLRRRLLVDTSVPVSPWAEDRVSGHPVEGQDLGAVDGSHRRRPPASAIEVTDAPGPAPDLPEPWRLRPGAGTVVDGALRGPRRRVTGS